MISHFLIKQNLTDLVKKSDFFLSSLTTNASRYRRSGLTVSILKHDNSKEPLLPVGL